MVEGAYTSIYNHQGNNQLCTIVAMNKEAEALPNDYDAAYALMERLAAEKGLTKAAARNP